MLDAQTAERSEQRNTRQQRGAAQVGTDEQWLAPHAVDPHACEQANQQHWRGLQRQEPAHIAGAGTQHEHGCEWHRGCGHPGAEGRDRLACPQLQEVRLTPQAASGRGLHVDGKNTRGA